MPGEVQSVGNLYGLSTIPRMMSRCQAGPSCMAFSATNMKHCRGIRISTPLRARAQARAVLAVLAAAAMTAPAARAEEITLQSYGRALQVQADHFGALTLSGVLAILIRRRSSIPTLLMSPLVALPALVVGAIATSILSGVFKSASLPSLCRPMPPCCWLPVSAAACG